MLILISLVSCVDAGAPTWCPHTHRRVSRHGWRRRSCRAFMLWKLAFCSLVWLACLWPPGGPCATTTRRKVGAGLDACAPPLCVKGATEAERAREAGLRRHKHLDGSRTAFYTNSPLHRRWPLGLKSPCSSSSSSSSRVVLLYCYYYSELLPPPPTTTSRTLSEQNC